MDHTRLLCIGCWILLIATNGGYAVEDEKYLTFPPNFLLGSATSAYQVEGAWNVNGKGESVWDRFVHEGLGRVVNNDTGDDACNSYYKFREDVALLKEIGFNTYRFSVSWPRILPEGFVHKINEDGIRYYRELIDELLANDIQPILTLYHWDHPQVIEDAGGWTNPNIVDWFGDYSRIIFKEFGSKVKLFITVNEPCYYCLNSYVYGVHAPGKKELRGHGEYLCLQNLLKAHTVAYRIYEREFKNIHNGKVGINIHIQSHYPKYPNQTETAEIAFQFLTGWVLHPIYSSEGDYPELMKQMVAKKSMQQGYSRSRLPQLGADWIANIRGASDFLSVNYYTSRMVEFGKDGEVPSFLNDWGILRTSDPSWKSALSSWLKIVPSGFGDALRKLSSVYGNPEMYITENGISTGDEIEDTNRVKYFQEYVKEMLLAINRDGVNVKGYTLWALLDNFEWQCGFSERFGIVHVNFTSPEKHRTLKNSANWWKNVIKNGKLPSSN